MQHKQTRSFAPGFLWRRLPLFAAEAPEGPGAPQTDAYATLADILQDEQARKRLILDLRALAAGETPEAPLAIC